MTLNRDNSTTGWLPALAIVFGGVAVLLLIIGWCHSDADYDLTPKISAEIERTADFSGVEEALSVLDGAQDIFRGNGAFGSRHLSYGLEDPYPAETTISQIRARLEAKGWKALSEDWLNPGLPSSHVDGWDEFTDATVTPRRDVHQWTAQWKDDSGNIVDYTFRYSYPENGQPNLSSLRISGCWYPVAGAKWMTME